MNNEKSNQNIFASSKTAVHPKQRIIQNFLLIWIDTGIDQLKQDCQNTLVQLQSVVNDVNVFTYSDECVDFLTELDDIKVFLIVADTLGRQIVPLIHDIPQLDTIYVSRDNKSEHEQWTKKWVKVKGVHTEMTSICEALQLATKQCNQDSIAVSFVTMDEGVSRQNLDQLEPSFMYTQILKEILLEIKHEEKSIKNLAVYCRQLYTENKRELNIINEFERDYRGKSPIWWYTRECFTYQMLNRALRALEVDTIINMGFFMRDLHHQIKELHEKQVNSYHRMSFVVYRGQGLFKTDFEKLLKTKGGLMSFNNFLSASRNRDVSLRFSKGALTKTDMVGILFKITIDPSVPSAPFASIRDVSYFQAEDEILFSMHTVFRIDKINKIDENSLLYEVELKLTADDDQQLRTLTKHIQKETAGEVGWGSLSTVLMEMGQFNKAEELCKILLDQTFDENMKAHYYNKLGRVTNQQGDYDKAIWYYKKALEIWEKLLPSNYSNLATCYNNIGLVYDNMGEYSKALLFYEKALEMMEKTLPPNHPNFAQTYDNFGTVYYHKKDYAKALSFYEKGLGIKEKTLPTNHPSLASSYNSIASVYENSGEYLKALSFFEKALETMEKTLPSNHPHFGMSYNNIAVLYNGMGEYSKALLYFEKTLEFMKKSLPTTHPLFGASQHNIAWVYINMKEYAKALSFLEKAREIFEKALPSNHPYLATSYTDFAMVYNKIGEYSKAFLFLEKLLEIRQKLLPANHPDLAIIYNYMGVLCYKTNQCSKTISYCQQAFNIAKDSLPPNHPNINLYKTNLEFAKRNCELFSTNK